MYQRILIPIDGSATSSCALKEAIKLAQEHSAQLALVNVYEDILYWIDESYINYEELQETIRVNAEKLLAKGQAEVIQVGLPIETKLLEAKNDRIEKVIIGEADRWHADLIVIGTHGRSGFSRLMLGSVAEGVARLASVPVLLIHCNEK